MERTEREKRNKAYLALAKARQEGLIQKKPCEACGEPKAQAHHDDYDKPLEVMWLCGSCHHKWHNKYGRGVKMRAPKVKDIKSLPKDQLKHSKVQPREGCFSDKQLFDWRKSYGWNRERAAKEMNISHDGYCAKEQGRRPITERDMEEIRRVDQDEAKKKAKQKATA
jgi:hypothetical protein